MLVLTTATMLAALSPNGDAAPAAPTAPLLTVVVAQQPPLPVPVAPDPVPVPTTAPVVVPQQTAPVPAGTPPKDIVVMGRTSDPGDPLRGVNAQAFGATQAVDGAVVGPVARAYKRKVPSPIRKGIHNFLYNLREPVVFVNFLLQFKPGKAAETVGRFLVNSTVGAAGIIDVAKKRPFRLPRRSNGFANTLGYHGIGNGPFLFLPLVGPTTVRDLIGGTLDRLLMPTAIGSPFTDASYTIPAGVLGALDHRADFDETLKCLHDDAGDPYASSRAFYLHRRQAEIDHLHRRPPAPAPECQAALPATRIPVGAAGATETVPPPGP